ncbi:MAG: hypothetical protein H7Y30_02055 [Pyrinomonadaceae bacterium]|nr:hypothetical protein [Pyrinomonadaceae bacterium]
MKRKQIIFRLGLLAVLFAMLGSAAAAQEAAGGDGEEEFGPVVRAYLGYLRGEQEVVDDRASRHEISPRYYRRNSNRIRALRQMAIGIARETGNDYLPELEAAARDELGTLFEKPPNPNRFKVGQVLNNTFRFLGAIRAGETFYVFARLDPYEQAELQKAEKGAPQPPPQPVAPLATSGEPEAKPSTDTHSVP